MEDLTKSNPRAASVRLAHASLKAAEGQRRHDLRIGRQPRYVDSAQSFMNRVLIPNAAPSLLRDLCAERRRAAGAKTALRRTAAVATSGIITFGSEAAMLFERLDADAQDAAFRDLTDRVADRLGATVHGLVVHRDEATIHAHFQLAAFNVHGAPLSAVCSPAVLAQVQDLAAEVMAQHCPGIERGRSKRGRLDAGADYAATLHRTVRELHRDLPADLEAKRAEVAAAVSDAQAAREKREKNERLATAARKKMKAAQKDEKKAKKLAKNMALYEGPAATAAKELADAEAKVTVIVDQIAALEATEAVRSAAAAEARRAMILERLDARRERRAARAVAAAEAAAIREAAAADAQAKAQAFAALASAAAAICRGAPVPDEDKAVIRTAADMVLPSLEAVVDLASQARADRAAAAKAALAAEAAATVAQEAHNAAAEDRAAAKIDRDAAKADRDAAKADRDAAARDRVEAASLRERLARIFDKVTSWLRRPDLPAAIRAEARQLALDAGRTDVPRPTLADLASAPQEPRQYPRPGGRDDPGPGWG